MTAKSKKIFIVAACLLVLLSWGFLIRISTLKVPGPEAVSEKSRNAGTHHPAPKNWRLHLVAFVESPLDDEVQQGILDGLQELGMIEDRDFEIKIGNAQGDMATLNSLIDRALVERADMLLVLSTPALQAAIQKTRTIPIVFASACPIQAGVGVSFEDHPANVTGVSTMADFQEMVRTIKECLPGARRIGTLFNPGEANSVILKDAFDAEARKGGIELITVPALATSDLADATLALLSKSIDAICQISDNVANAGFAAIAARAQQAKKPLFCFSSALTDDGGAAVGVARDLTQAGRDMASLAARIMAGENPEEIPFTLVSRTRITVNPKNAQLCGLSIPGSLMERADEVSDE